MTKRSLLQCVAGLIFLAIFNAVFFILGIQHRAGYVWIPYIFIHISYALLLFSIIQTERYRNKADFGYPLIGIASVYFIITLIAGIVTLILRIGAVRGLICTNLIITGIFVLIYVIMLLNNDRIERSLK